MYQVSQKASGDERDTCDFSQRLLWKTKKPSRNAPKQHNTEPHANKQ